MGPGKQREDSHKRELQKDRGRKELEDKFILVQKKILKFIHVGCLK